MFGLFDKKIRNTKVIPGPIVPVKPLLTPEQEEAMHRAELVKKIKGMDDAEFQIVAANIPIKYILQRMDDEINEKMVLEKRIEELNRIILPKED